MLIASITFKGWNSDSAGPDGFILTLQSVYCKLVFILQLRTQTVLNIYLFFYIIFTLDWILKLVESQRCVTFGLSAKGKQL